MTEEEKLPEQEQDETKKNMKNPDFLWTLPEEEDNEIYDRWQSQSILAVISSKPDIIS